MLRASRTSAYALHKLLRGAVSESLMTSSLTVYTTGDVKARAGPVRRLQRQGACKICFKPGILDLDTAASYRTAVH
jgi:hypothetical protein